MKLLLQSVYLYSVLSTEVPSDDLPTENKRLKRLLAQKEEGLAIVKKAVTCFAQELK